MLSREQGLEILTEYTSTLTSDQRAALFDRHTVTRSVRGVETALYDPYAAALAYLMNPATVKSRTQGSVTEQYIDPTTVAAYLEGQSTLLRESWPPPDVTAGGTAFDDLTLDVIGWGR